MPSHTPSSAGGAPVKQVLDGRLMIRPPPRERGAPPAAHSQHRPLYGARIHSPMCRRQTAQRPTDPGSMPFPRASRMAASRPACVHRPASSDTWRDAAPGPAGAWSEAGATRRRRKAAAGLPRCAYRSASARRQALERHHPVLGRGAGGLAIPAHHRKQFLEWRHSHRFMLPRASGGPNPMLQPTSFRLPTSSAAAPSSAHGGLSKVRAPWVVRHLSRGTPSIIHAAQAHLEVVVEAPSCDRSPAGSPASRAVVLADVPA